MLPPHHVSLRVVEAAYDLDSHPAPWLGGLLRSGEGVLDQGFGCAAVAIAGRTRSGEPLVSRVVTHHDASNSLALRLARASRSVQVDDTLPGLQTATSVVRTLSGLRCRAPRLHRAVRQRIGCRDALCVLAVDSELHGVLLLTPTRGRISLGAKAERRWQVLASHIGAADRLRRALGRSNQERLIPVSSLTRELMSEAHCENAPSAPSGRSLQEQAVRIDSQRRAGPERQANQARRMLRGLVEGELSMIDWFIRDGRCFTLARRAERAGADPRALSSREQQVVLRTARGESRKLVGYHLGIDRTQVSRMLACAMRKLGVKNQSELVVKVRCLERHELLDER